MPNKKPVSPSVANPLIYSPKGCIFFNTVFFVECLVAQGRAFEALALMGTSLWFVIFFKGLFPIPSHVFFTGLSDNGECLSKIYVPTIFLRRIQWWNLFWTVTFGFQVIGGPKNRFFKLLSFYVFWRENGRGAKISALGPSVREILRFKVVILLRAFCVGLGELSEC